MIKNKKDIINPYVIPGLKREGLSDEVKAILTSRIKTNLIKEEILNIISNEIGTSIEKMFSKCKDTECVFGRHIYIKILKLNGKNLVEIGREMGKDHTTIIHAIRTFNDRYKVEADYRKTTNKIFNMIGIDPKLVENENTNSTSRRRLNNVSK